MNELFKKLATLHSHKLTPTEREVLRERTFAFMAEHPILALAPEPVRAAQSPSPILIWKSLSLKRFISLTALGVFAVSGGIAFAAQGALPGDALYPVKINVTEKVEQAFAVTPKASADFARKEIERRAQEAEALVATDRLNATTSAELAHATQVHFAAFTQAQTELEHEGKAVTAQQSEDDVRKVFMRHQAVFADMGIEVDVATSSAVANENSDKYHNGTGTASRASDSEAPQAHFKVNFGINKEDGHDSSFVVTSTATNTTPEDAEGAIRIGSGEPYSTSTQVFNTTTPKRGEATATSAGSTTATTSAGTYRVNIRNSDDEEGGDRDDEHSRTLPNGVNINGVTGVHIDD